MTRKEELKKQILELTREYYREVHAPQPAFEAGKTRVNYGGRYFADEDGFGMEDNDEVNITAYIDTQCRVVVKFQDMEDEGKRRRLREEAIKALSKE